MTTLRFGEYELHENPHCLTRRGNQVYVQDLPLRLLVLLVSRPGELISREALFQQFWPDDRSGMLDDNLNTVVRKLRLALHDSARSPRFVETIPKKGYRFISPVVAATPLATENIKEAEHSSSPRIISAVRMVALVVLVLGCGAWIEYRFIDRSTGSQHQAIKTVAVMPFVNANQGRQRDYFTDGLADDLLNRLSEYAQLRVVSRTSSFSMEQSSMDARQIGAALNAEALVEGTVWKDGKQLRVNVRLVDTQNGYQLWSQSYQHELSDVVEVQGEIALQIASALAGELSAVPQKSSEIIVPEAYDSYLKGRFFWHQRTEASLTGAVSHFERAIELAPEYAPAWAGLADALAVMGFYDYLAPSVAFSRAKGAARRALQLDPKNASAEANLGYVALYYEWDFPEAEARFNRAIALKADSSKAHQWYANYLVAAGRFDEAEREMRRATELDPLSLIANAALGWVLYNGGQYVQALEQLALTEELNPGFELIYLWRGWSLEALGDLPSAAASLQECVRRSGGSAISQASLARVLALQGKLGQAQEILTALDSSSDYQPAYEIAKAYLALGQPHAAWRWFQKAVEQRSHSMVFLAVDPQLQDYRSTQAYQQLLAEVFPEP
ncbi:winged helix-turn-helix domain-containing tetratricopeptide repeat protein [Alteromonas aestuariivivens]|nr:FlgO family outer membrane protein [Alteromonas aestuariivivens]